MFEKVPKISLYEILQVSKQATENEIKKSYRKLAKIYHPDKQENKDNLSDAEVEKINEKFRILNQAYEILVDAQSRSLYDQSLDKIELQKKKQKEYEERRKFEKEMLEKQAEIDREKMLKFNKKVKIKKQSLEQEKYVNNLMQRRNKAQRIRQLDEIKEQVRKNNEMAREYYQNMSNTANLRRSNTSMSGFSNLDPGQMTGTASWPNLDPSFQNSQNPPSAPNFMSFGDYFQNTRQGQMHSQFMPENGSNLRHAGFGHPSNTRQHTLTDFTHLAEAMAKNIRISGSGRSGAGVGVAVGGNSGRDRVRGLMSAGNSSQYFRENESLSNYADRLFDEFFKN